MVRQLTTDVENNFSRGLITQATGITFPQNSCTSTTNCIHHELGYVQRRPGFDFEDNFSTTAINRTLDTVVNYYWRNVTGDGSVNLLVAQIGSTLHFWLPGAEGFSAGYLATTVDLTGFMPSGAPSPSLAECQFSTGLGYLFVVHPTLEAFYVTYNSSAQTVSATEITIQIRDTEGLADGVVAGVRPNSLSSSHEYNLYNQGWYVSGGSYMTAFESAMSVYPSNGDVWWVYKNFDDTFDTSTITSVIYDLGTSQAPKGHYILTAFNQDRTAASGIGSFTPVSSGYQRPSTVAFFSGRAWYGGTAAQGFESKIYFSQIIENINQAGYCYSAEDPTAQDYDDIQDDDGGWLSIPGIGLIQKILPLGSNLIVFGTMGIYQITGSTGTGFTADSYSTNFLSSVKTLSGTSFVDVQGFPAWWTLDGIYILMPTVATATTSSTLQVQSLTDSSIKDYYLDIPVNCKRYARGAYDPRSHTIQWIFKSIEPSGLTDNYSFDSVLNYNTISNGFYPWLIPLDGTVSINGIFLADGFGVNPTINNITDGGVQVTDSSGANNVVEVTFGQTVLDYSNMFLVSYPNSGSYNFTFANYANTDYIDWFSYDNTGVDYTSSFQSGYKMPTAGSKRFGDSYIYIFSDLRLIDETDFYFQSQWDFANTGDSGKWSSLQRITYENEYPFDIVRNRLKVRGSGFVVQFLFTSISGQPFHILGWTVSETVATRD